jgi:nicotinamide-nucleotide amidase
MKAEIITIGDEILIGQIIDSNSAWIGEQLNLAGMDVVRITSISDTPQAIKLALDAVFEDTILVLITGGLGPTKDDLTKHTLSEYFNMPLVYKQEIFDHITRLFATMGRVPNELNRGQAWVPDDCFVLENNVGTAPGMLFLRNGKYYVSMPGVPYEMKYLMTTHVLPMVESKLLHQVIIHKTLLTVGLPESELAELISEAEDQLPPFIKLAYLPKPGRVRLRLSARGDNRQLLEEALAFQVQKIKNVLGTVVFGEDDEALEKVVGEILKLRGETLCTAESCTGGYIAHLITSIAGCSTYFMGSVVSYANQAKVDFLDVNAENIKTDGAVSELVVRQMAENARKKFGTTWALATSGIAGPDGGTPEKPVGTVWIALAGENGTEARKFAFGKDRLRNIQKSATAALEMLRAALIKKY